MYTLHVNLNGGYDVAVLKTVESFNGFLNGDICGKKILLVTDKTVYKNCYTKIESAFNGFSVTLYVISGGEKSKNFNAYIKGINLLKDNGFTRNDLIIALGGGVVGDLAGFIASTYMRGIKFINMPTTLLSMVDSCIGGKTGIDLAGKNLVGTFYQPYKVVIITEFLKTLKNAEIRQGLCEAVKCAFISSDVKYSYIKNKNYEELILSCLTVKKELIEKDEFDTLNLRVKLNLGHTVGHVLEVLSNYKIKHGDAVLFGLKCAFQYSVKNGIFVGDKDKALKLLNLVKLKKFDVNVNEFEKYLLLDKKNINGKINYLVIKNVGEVENWLVDIKAVKENFIESSNISE